MTQRVVPYESPFGTYALSPTAARNNLTGMYHADGFGAKMDRHTATDGAITSGTAVLATSLGAVAQVGMAVSVLNALTAGIASPVISSVTQGGTAGATSYSYQVVARNGNRNKTLPSATVTTTTGNATLSGTNFNTIAWGAVTGRQDYEIYRGGKLIGRTTNTTFNDTGQTVIPSYAEPTGVTPPIADSTGTHLLTTVASVDSPTQITLNANATHTVTGAFVTVGTDNTTAINNALAAGGEVYLPAKPDQGDAYLITGPLVIQSGSKLRQHPQSCIGLAPGALCNLLTNHAVAAGGTDTDITIEGGAWDRSYDAGPASGDFTPRHMLKLRHIIGLKIRDVFMKSKGGKFSISYADITDFAFERIYFQTHSDGVHGMGPLKRGKISGLFGTTGDDFCAIGSTDFVGYQDSIGSISDVDIDSLFVMNGSSLGHPVAMWGATGYLVRGLSVKKIKGETSGSSSVQIAGSALVTGFQTSPSSDLDVTIDDVSCMPNAYGLSTSCSMVEITTHAGRDITIRNLTWDGSPTAASAVVLAKADAGGQDTNIDRLLVDGVTIKNAGSSFHVVRPEGQSVGTVIVRNVRGALGASSAVVEVNANNVAISRLIIGDIALTSGTSVVQAAFTSGVTIPIIEIANAQLAGLSWIADLNISSEIDLTNISTSSGIANLRAGTEVVRVKAGTLKATGATKFTIGAGSALSCDGKNIPVDVSTLTPTDGDIANNTNAALGCGVGPAVYNTAAAKWKNLYTGLTT